jgi:hypothetical protein
MKKTVNQLYFPLSGNKAGKDIFEPSSRAPGRLTFTVFVRRLRKYKTLRIFSFSCVIRTQAAKREARCAIWLVDKVSGYNAFLKFFPVESGWTSLGIVGCHSVGGGYAGMAFMIALS